MGRGTHDDGEGRARRILAEAGIVDEEPLQRVEGNWSNEVWIGQRYVVRIGLRNPRWLEHEAAVADVLPSGVPYPRPIATRREDGTFWTVAPRINGVPLYVAWAQADGPGRQEELMRALAVTLRL